MKHGVYIYEQGTALTVPVVGNSSVQVVIGTAPVHMVENPEQVVNVPVLANSAAEAMAALGYVDDFNNFTLCQTMYITNNIFQVSPVVYINVLDPQKHNKAIATETVAVESMQAKIAEQGVVPSTLVLKNGDTTLAAGTDYTTEFDTDGTLIINLIKGGKGASAASLAVTGKVVDPTAVTKTDIIGSYNAATGKETGMELIRQVYPKLKTVPGLLLAPGWSQEAEVGIALAAKAANINGVFKAMALVDIDTNTATKYTDCGETKENSGFTSEFCYPSWLCYKVGDYIFAGSAVNAALIAYTDAENEDVPSVSPSNKLLGITGTCLADGTEVNLDLDQANVVNSFGVATAFNMNGWKLWGNYTGAYPSSKDAKDIWLAVRRMFNWQGNTFIQSYFDKVDDPMNSVLIESVVDSENIRCAAYAPDKWAGANIQYLKSDNPDTDILAGKMTFRQSIAPYTPAQEINNILSYDTSMLSNALTGGE
ncbi:phage tail sheath family protein [Dorea acetigenes]|uniref:Phage tail sheath family protein n=1 Tax=Dorea acetigenes TaxID=2981787 RepID=A0ABT2RJS2_9FIRM|nr:phage tail sheath family protein [Dorea acetigenes]MCU6685667.1 phage tail sheath family protein [Dorea acetigenes]SCI58927.1 Uncharacterised protein [uncultured Clostridium sp.]